MSTLKIEEFASRMQRNHSDAPSAPLANETMTRDELRALAVSMYGQRWRRPLARALGCDKRFIQFLERGERRITPVMAAKIRAEVVLAGLSEAALLVRSVLSEEIPKATHKEVHRAAQIVVAELERRGLLRQHRR